MLNKMACFTHSFIDSLTEEEKKRKRKSGSEKEGNCLE